jgi:signal transduction histidine kinase
VKRCDQIVQNVLRLARDEPSAKSLHNVNDIVRDACRAAAVPARRPGVDVQLELDENLARAAVNPLDIERAIITLIHNAALASQPGSMVTVRTVDCPHAVRIVVQDHGQGIADAERPHIFDPFYTNRRNSPGTGMGLPLVHKIVQEHGGTIVVQSQLGMGSTFSIDLPQVKHATLAAKDERKVS